MRSAVEAWSPNHCIARESLLVDYFIPNSLYLLLAHPYFYPVTPPPTTGYH